MAPQDRNQRRPEEQNGHKRKAAEAVLDHDANFLEILDGEALVAKARLGLQRPSEGLMQSRYNQAHGSSCCNQSPVQVLARSSYSGFVSIARRKVAVRCFKAQLNDATASTLAKLPRHKSWQQHNMDRLLLAVSLSCLQGLVGAMQTLVTAPRRWQGRPWIPLSVSIP